jgi:diguanylate cyclase (GGDEF)-like protein
MGAIKEEIPGSNRGSERSAMAESEKLPGRSESFPQQLHGQLAQIERRDWELWLLALAMVAILALGYFFIIFPAVFLGQKTFYLEATVSSQLMIGQMILLLLFLAYLIHKQIHLRSERAHSIREALNYQVSHAQLMLDPLTRAFNRTALEEIIGKEVQRVIRKKTTLLFLFIDVNDLKKVNTRFGHLSGDLVLTEVGAILKKCVRGSDYVIRMGGDEFLVALLDTNEPGAEIVKRRMNEQTKQWNQASPLPGFEMSLSIGLQVFDGSRSFDEVMAEVDAKMYAEKTARQSQN